MLSDPHENKVTSSTAALQALVDEVALAKKGGTLAALKERFTTDHARSNHSTVVLWRLRWARICEFLAAGAPDVIALQELDRAEDVQRDLATMGYTMSYTPSGWG